MSAVMLKLLETRRMIKYKIVIAEILMLEGLSVRFTRRMWEQLTGVLRITPPLGLSLRRAIIFKCQTNLNNP